MLYTTAPVERNRTTFIGVQKLYGDSRDVGRCLGDEDYAYNCYSIFYSSHYHNVVYVYN